MAGAVFFVRDYLGPGASEVTVGRYTGFLVRPGSLPLCR